MLALQRSPSTGDFTTSSSSSSSSGRRSSCGHVLQSSGGRGESHVWCRGLHKTAGRWYIGFASLEVFELTQKVEARLLMDHLQSCLWQTHR